MQPVQLQLLQAMGMLPFHQVVGFTVGVNSVTGGEMICDIVFVILLGIQFLLCLHTKYIHH